MKEWNETAHKLLDAAEGLIKERGFNAFSFRDLQREVGVKTSTIHYYFSTKTDLGEAAAERFLERHKEALASLEVSESSAVKRLHSIAGFFASNSAKGEFCLGGMLTSDLHAMNSVAGSILRDFFDHFEKWIETTVKLGKSRGEINESVDTGHFARLFVAVLEGGMLISRVKQDEYYFNSLLNPLIEQIKKKGKK